MCGEVGRGRRAGLNQFNVKMFIYSDSVQLLGFVLWLHVFLL